MGQPDSDSSIDKDIINTCIANPLTPTPYLLLHVDREERPSWRTRTVCRRFTCFLGELIVMQRRMRGFKFSTCLYLEGAQKYPSLCLCTYSLQTLRLLENCIDRRHSKKAFSYLVGTFNLVLCTVFIKKFL
jgi:hypothetical protein